MQYTQHPLSSAFPAMSPDEFAALVADIREHGQRDVATIYDGMVLDGWHRYRACCEIGIPCRTEPFSGADALAFVRSKNQHRRHYMKSQQAAVEVALATWAESHRPKKGEVASPFSTNKEMAERAGTTERTIIQAKRAHEAGLGGAVRDGVISVEKAAAIAKNPELAEQVASGTVPALVAARQVAAQKPKQPRTETNNHVVSVKGQCSDHEDEGSDDDHSLSLDELVDELQRENEQLRGELEAATADDASAEALKWRRMYDNAVRQQSEAMEASAREQRRADMLNRKLRQCCEILGLDDDRSLIPELRKLAGSAGAP